jgi:hypothetical protein
MLGKLMNVTFYWPEDQSYQTFRIPENSTIKDLCKCVKRNGFATDVIFYLDDIQLSNETMLCSILFSKQQTKQLQGVPFDEQKTPIIEIHFRNSSTSFSNQEWFVRVEKLRSHVNELYHISNKQFTMSLNNRLLTSDDELIYISPNRKTTILVDDPNCIHCYVNGPNNPSEIMDFQPNFRVSEVHQFVQRMKNRFDFHLRTSDSETLPEDWLLEEIPPPRNLFVVYDAIRVTLSSRDHSSIEETFQADATVGEAEAKFGIKQPGIRFANEYGRLCFVTHKLSELPDELYLVPSEFQMTVSLQLQSQSPINIEVDSREKVNVFMTEFAKEQNFEITNAVFVDNNGILLPNTIFGAIKGLLRANIASVPYTFVYNRMEFQAWLQKTATVLEAKVEVAKQYDLDVNQFFLVFRGHKLCDHFSLIQQRIQNDDRLIVSVKRIEKVLVSSFSGTRREIVDVNQPPNWMELINRLRDETGRDPRICGRSLAFYGYDYNAALKDLKEF